MPLSFPDSDAGDEFSNNLFSDLAPLLALFGEDVAKQFMTASMGWADNIIFAMAPIGVITAIVSAIRIGGSVWLKGLIGRVKENTACAEEQLTSSASNEIYKIFNRSHIVRLMGAPAIKELIYIRPKEVTAQDNPGRQIQAFPSCAGSTVTQNSDIAKIENEYNVWTLQDAEKIGDMVKEQGSSFLQEIWQLRPKTSGPSTDQRPAPSPPHDLEHQAAGPEELLDKQDPEKESPQPKDGVSDDTIDDDGPLNISLNMRGRVRQKELYIVAAIGVILQVAVLVFDWFITYHPGFKQKKGGKDMAPYAFPITSTGTVTLVVGMLVCCYIVESSTTDSSYMANGADLHMLWLQQGGVVSDQMFDSYVLLAREKRDVVTISRRVKIASGGGTGNSIFVRFLTAFGSAVSVIGFVLQFVGLRAMNWSASVAQFVATVIMIILRAYVRRGRSDTYEGRAEKS